MARRRFRELLSGMTLAFAVGGAGGCGGQSQKTTGDSRSDAGDGGSGGSVSMGGTAGTVAMGGTAGTVATGGTAGTGATGGTGGSVGTCNFWGETHDNEVEFVAPDGCNTCVCHEFYIECTLVECTPEGDCDELETAYDWALEWAQECTFECGAVVMSAIQCGCPVHANAEKGVGQLDRIAAAWRALGCAEPPAQCRACPDAPMRGYCSTHGMCIEVPAE
jgi:hypothetical protein